MNLPPQALDEIRSLIHDLRLNITSARAQVRKAQEKVYKIEELIDCDD